MGERTPPQKTAPQPRADNPNTAPPGNDDRPEPSRRKRRLRHILLTLGPLAVAVAAAYVYLTGGRYVSTDNAYIKADKVMIAAEVSGVITDVPVRENQRVSKGDVLFRIDDRAYRIALAEAEARLAGVRDEIASLKAAYRQKREEMVLAHANAAFANYEFERQTKLLETSVTSRKKLEDARHEFDVARQRIRVTEQELAQILPQLAGDPDIKVERHPRHRAAAATHDRMALDLERTVVRAPFDGIARNVPEPGRHVVGNGSSGAPVMSVVADREIWIEANFKETDLTHVRPGLAAVVRVDTYPDREWRGVVESISPATGAEFSVIPPQNATGNWVKVVQRIPVRVSVKSDGPAPVLRVGMSAVVEIDTGRARELPGFLRTALSWLSGGPATQAATTGER